MSYRITTNCGRTDRVITIRECVLNKLITICMKNLQKLLLSMLRKAKGVRFEQIDHNLYEEPANMVAYFTRDYNHG